MSRNDIDSFIERMEEIGDIWEPEDVERVYGKMSLEEAIEDRMGDMMAFGNINGTILNR